MITCNLLRLKHVWMAVVTLGRLAHPEINFNSLLQNAVFGGGKVEVRRVTSEGGVPCYQAEVRVIRVRV